MALADPAMRRQFDDFNLALLPGIVAVQFPVKTFKYQILDGKQSRFAFEIGLDASKLMEAFNQGVLNTRVSSLKLDTGGKAGRRPARVRFRRLRCRCRSACSAMGCSRRAVFAMASRPPCPARAVRAATARA